MSGLSTAVLKPGYLLIPGQELYGIGGSCQMANNVSCTWCFQVLRSPKEAFAAAMQLWSERCEKCVCLQGDYVEK